MWFPDNSRLTPSPSPFGGLPIDWFGGESNPFGPGTGLKFDTTTIEPSLDQSEETESRLEEDTLQSGILLFQRSFSFRKEKVFTNIQSRDLKHLSMGQTSYHQGRTIVAFNQKSLISFLILDENKQETFCQKAIRSKSSLFSSCGFFEDPSPSLLAYSVYQGPVKVFDGDAQRSVLSLPLQADVVAPFSTSLAVVDSASQQIQLFDIRSAEEIAVFPSVVPKESCVYFSISRNDGHVAVSSSAGCFFGDLRKPSLMMDVSNEVRLRSPLGWEPCIFNHRTDVLPNHNADGQSVITTIFLAKGLLLVVDYKHNTAAIIQIPAFSVAHSLSFEDVILDTAVSLVHSLIAVLLSSAELGGVRKLLLLDFSLTKVSETYLDKRLYHSLGFFGESGSLLLNGTDDFTLYTRVLN
jgi:hypothetical protein